MKLLEVKGVSFIFLKSTQVYLTKRIYYDEYF